MFEVINIVNPNWDVYVKKLKQYDVFYLSSYVKAFQSSGEGAPILIVYSNENEYAINVVFKRDIAQDVHFRNFMAEGNYFDLISPYGYGGFIGNVSNWELLMDEWQVFCKANGFVSEFVRFHLFSGCEKHYTGIVESHTHNVVRNLEIPSDEMWMDFKAKVRKNVKKANNFGLKVICDDTGEHLEDFLQIYYGTMDRNDAADNFYFTRDFFEKILEMKDNVMLFHVIYEDKIISTEMVIYGAENAYSYLGGTDREYFNLRPNDLLKYEIIKWAKDKGLKNFVLGGGYGADDGIFQYKTCLAPNGIVDFYIGKKVLDRDVYMELCKMRNLEMDTTKLENGFFPAYRRLGGGGGLWVNITGI